MTAGTDLEVAAARLAALLTGAASTLAEPGRSELVFEPAVELRPLRRGPVPPDVWAVDGGQAVVADARCLQLLVTRAARVRFVDGRCEEDEGPLRTVLLGGEDERAAAVAALAVPGLRADSSVDINLLRDRWEWEAIERCVAEAAPGGLVLVDGDLQPDWRIPSRVLAGILATAIERGVTLAGVTKHSSLSHGGAPLLGALELEAEVTCGPRAMWWGRVAHTRADVGGVEVLAARLDPDARFAFRIDLPAGADSEAALAAVAAVADDAAFPGYPYPLSVADRLAACPGWLRADMRLQLDDQFDRLGVPTEVRERAFADRHGLMERA